MSSANNNIPFVPENTIDPAAGLNESIKVIDALIQLSVVGVNVNAPPASPVAGDRYIIGTAPTGAWVGQSGKMAQWLDDKWNFYTAYFCVSGGIIYSRSSGVWAPVSGSGEANTASNIGSGSGVFASKTGVDLQFKSLVGGSNVSITESGDALTISASGAVDPATTDWGAITGTLSAQTDLQGALDAKASAGDLTSGLEAKQDKVASVTETGTSRTLVLTDAGKYLRFTNTSAKTCTVPPQGSVAWADDTEVHVRNAAASNLTLTPGSGVTLNAPYNGTLVVPPQGTVTLKRVASNSWDVMGVTV